MIVYGGDEEIAEWVKSRIPMECQWACPRALGVARQGRLIAGVVYYNWRPPDIQVAMAADSPWWATKENIFTLLAYPFYQLGVGRVTALVARSNRRSRRLLEGLGFTLEGKLRKAIAGTGDMMIYGYLREEFEASKWANHGQEEQRRTYSPADA